ncbi:MAG: response regulator [Planctomycetota bacterium]|jgi:DNA-binding NarL/FixJ family response regulator
MKVGKKITVLIVDDHVLMCEGLRALLRNQPDMEVIGVAQSGSSAVKMALELRPDVVLMDINMAGLDGIDATRQIMKEIRNTKILALSAYPHKHNVAQMLKAGAVGFLDKEVVFDELSRAIRSVYKNESYLSDKAKEVLVNDYIKHLQEHLQPNGSLLTEREYEVIRFICKGKSTKEIARFINMSPKTVDACRRVIMEKLGIDSIAELTKFAIRQGLTDI